ncbi:MAG: hypothetical protein BWX88_03624 [Planctomycetes bacterium ADurb.Bin126]|nr:MAG: hypothetical protein BWX88_03624 [Planctomycetes bacterium ADurb.Bin126]
MVSLTPASLVPPTRMSFPLPAVMVSLPPPSSAVVMTSPMVIGRPESCGASALAAVIFPLSPRARLLPSFKVIVSLPVPPITMSDPLPTVIVSFPPIASSLLWTRSRSPAFVSAPGWVCWPGRSARVKSSRPLSPRMRLPASVPPDNSPSLAVIVSPPWPPSTTSLPVPVVIVSSPPSADEIVSTRPSVMAMPESCGASAAAAVTRPLSPMTRLLPPPAEIVSPYRPPTTTSLPAPVVISSTPPAEVVERLSMRSMSAGFRSAPAAVASRSARTKSILPSSPRTILLPSPAPMMSPAWPPRTMSPPLPVVIWSTPPIPNPTVSTRPTVSGSVPNLSVSAWAEVILPESPMTRLLPPPAEIPSAPAPPTTRSLPAPVVMVSSPP